MPSNVPFGHDWADAAARVANVLRIEVKKKLSWPALETCPILAQNPLDPTWYELERAISLPRRILGPGADLPIAARTIRALRYLQQVHGPIDILHAHFYSSARYFPYIESRMDIPYVVTEHSTALTLESPDKKITRRGRRIAASVYRKAATVMPVSQSLLQAILALDLQGRFVVVPNPVDESLFRPGSDRDSRERVELVTVARLAAVKGVDTLLQAVALLRRSLRIHLTVIGGGPLEGELKKLRSDLDLEETVDFAGWRSRNEIADYLRNSDIFVLASRAENLPVAVIEAMMSGLPVVATSVGGLPELIRSGNGILVDREDSRALAQALRRIVAGLSKHDRDATAADAIRRYSMKSTSRSLKRIYERIADRV